MFQFLNRNITRVLGVLRFLISKTLYFRSFKTKGMYVVEFGARIKVLNRGQIGIDKNAHLFPHSSIISKGVLKIGKSFNINNYSRVVSHEKIIIGDNVTIAQFVSILDHDHAYKIINNQMKLDGYDTSPIIIGSNVWIADKVSILKGVRIGNNVIIGANSVVNKDIPDNSIAVGSPAKVVKSIV